ncbi:MAG: hypothetical protein ACOCVF_02930 [bacterium]
MEDEIKEYQVILAIILMIILIIILLLGGYNKHFYSEEKCGCHGNQFKYNLYKDNCIGSYSNYTKEHKFYKYTEEIFEACT